MDHVRFITGINGRKQQYSETGTLQSFTDRIAITIRTYLDIPKSMAGKSEYEIAQYAGGRLLFAAKQVPGITFEAEIGPTCSNYKCFEDGCSRISCIKAHGAESIDFERLVTIRTGESSEYQKSSFQNGNPEQVTRNKTMTIETFIEPPAGSEAIDIDQAVAYIGGQLDKAANAAGELSFEVVVGYEEKVENELLWAPK